VSPFNPNHNNDMTSAVFTPRHLAAWLLGSCALASWSTAAWSADSAAASALKALLGPQAAFQQSGGLPPTPAHSAGGAAHASGAGMTPEPGALAAVGSTVTVQRGETLDRLIRRTLPDVPLHPDFLRKAFVSLNPQVFPSGSPNRMLAGARMQVPSMAALRQMMLSQHPSSAALLQGGDARANHAGSIDPSDQRSWVRFP
jgi:Tfp pilus assembly protein FimV